MLHTSLLRSCLVGGDRGLGLVLRRWSVIRRHQSLLSFRPTLLTDGITPSFANRILFSGPLSLSHLVGYPLTCRCSRQVLSWPVISIGSLNIPPSLPLLSHRSCSTEYGGSSGLTLRGLFLGSKTYLLTSVSATPPLVPYWSHRASKVRFGVAGCFGRMLRIPVTISTQLHSHP